MSLLVEQRLLPICERTLAVLLHARALLSSEPTRRRRDLRAAHRGRRRPMGSLKRIVEGAHLLGWGWGVGVGDGVRGGGGR